MRRPRSKSGKGGTGRTNPNAFDPAKMAVKQEPVASESAPTHPPSQLTVSQLATLIERVLRDHAPTGLKVVGEIGQFRERSHWYFDIKDAGAVVSCVMWASMARKAGFTPRPGQQVLVTGRVEFYPPQGRTQFIVDRIEAVGAGALDLALRKMVEELRALGWLDEARKRPLPLMPRRVAIVTSRTGAALQDVLDTFARRCPGVPLGLFDVRVQGEGAAEQVAKAVRRIGAMHATLGIDVILVTRGGGSMEDLWAFNERVVAEAIVQSPIPVVCAIGHETDVTVAELVADVRGATPTQAAMRIAPDAGALRQQLSSMGSRLSSLVERQCRLDQQRLANIVRHAHGAVRHGVDARAHRLEQAAVRIERCRPAAVYAERASRLGHVEARLQAAITRRVAAVDVDALALQLRAAGAGLLQRCAVSVDAAARSLDLVGPHSVLGRGYSMTLHADGRVVRSAGGVSPGELVRTRLGDGSFTSRVSGEGGERTPLREVAPARRPRKSAQQDRRDQMDLFGAGG